MMHRYSLITLLTALATLLAFQLYAGEPAEAVVHRTTPGLLENAGQLIDQHGNARPDLLAVAESHGVQVFIGKNSLHYQFRQAANPEALAERFANGPRRAPQPGGYAPLAFRYHRVDVHLVGANPNPEVVRQEVLPGKENYYHAHCPEGITGVRRYERFVLKEVYPHIDWVLYREGAFLKYDFVVRPGGNPADIRLRFSGADKLEHTPEGKLRITTSLGRVEEQRPLSFQSLAGGQALELPTAFQLQGNELSFHLPFYKSGSTLRIDPYIVWGTYYGGADEDRGNGVATDEDGNAFITGRTASTNNIATTGAHQQTLSGGGDMFVAAFDSTGVRLWATYYGGLQEDGGLDVAADTVGNVFVIGQTSSTAAIASSNGFVSSFAGGSSDAFLVKFDDSGVRKWGTYYGGSAWEEGIVVTTDNTGDVYIGGRTESNNGISTGGTEQPTFGGFRDAFVVKFSTTGSRKWGTYFGGGNEDYAFGIDVDNNFNVLLTGWTNSASGVATSGAHQTTYAGGTLFGGDAFLVKYDSTGNRQWSTYYGGSGYDFGLSVAADANGDVYLSGSTENSSAIATPGSHQPTYGGGTTAGGDAYLAKFDPNGNRLWATYYGGGGDDFGRAVAVDTANAVYMAGETNSAFGIATIGSYNGSVDAYLVKFDPNGNRLGANYYGGVDLDDCQDMEPDRFGHILLTGRTGSGSGIADVNAHQNTEGGIIDGYLARFSQFVCQPTSFSFAVTTCQAYTVPSGNAVYTTSQIVQDTIPNSEGCDSVLTIDLTILPGSSTNIDVTACDSFTVPSGEATYYSSQLVVDVLPDQNGCDSVLNINLTVISNAPPITQSGNTLTVNGGNSWQWLDCDNNFQPLGVTTPSFTPTQDGNYAVIVSTGPCTDTSDCFNFMATQRPQLTNLPGVKVFPNPTEGAFTVTGDFSAGNPAHFALYDATGREVFRQTLTQPSTRVRPNLAAGVYQLRLHNAKATHTARLVIR